MEHDKVEVHHGSQAGEHHSNQARERHDSQAGENHIQDVGHRSQVEEVASHTVVV